MFLKFVLKKHLLFLLVFFIFVKSVYSDDEEMNKIISEISNDKLKFKENVNSNNAMNCFSNIDSLNNKNNENKDTTKDLKNEEKIFKSMEMERKISVERWKRQSDINRCKLSEKRKSGKCEMILACLGKAFYEHEDIVAIIQENELKQWCKERNNDVKKYPQCVNAGEEKRNHKESLSIYNDYLKYFPEAPNAPEVLYIIAHILFLEGKEEWIDYYNKIIYKYPGHALAPNAWFRIGENYHYKNSKWTDAIEVYKKVLNSDKLQSKYAKLSMYHLAESYYSIPKYDSAAYTFFEYIQGADIGKYSSDLRVEAMDYMAKSFSDLDSGVTEAHKFLHDKDVAFKDSLYFNIGMKNKVHIDTNNNKEIGNPDKAIQSFKFLLDISPNYIDAPKAELEMVNILANTKGFYLDSYLDSAQKIRKGIPDRYDTNSEWYRKNNDSYPEHVKKVQDSIVYPARRDIPRHTFEDAKKLDKKGDKTAAKKEYSNAINESNNFLSNYEKETECDTLKIYDVLRAKEDIWHSANRVKEFEDSVKAISLSYKLPETQSFLRKVENYVQECGESSVGFDMLYTASMEHYYAKNFSEAIKSFDRLLKAFPNNEKIRWISFLRAEVLAWSGQFDKSIEEAERLYSLYPNKNNLNKKDSNTLDIINKIERLIVSTVSYKGEELIKNKQYKKATDTMIAVVKRFPNTDVSDEALFKACSTYVNGEFYNEAISCYRSLKIDYPKSDFFLLSTFSIPSIYSKLQKWDSAAIEYTNIIKYSNDKERYMEAYRGTAYAYKELGNYAKATEFYKRVLDIYERYGSQFQNVKSDIPAEAAFYLGEFEAKKMNFKISSNYYITAQDYGMIFPARNGIAMLYLTIATKISEQEIITKEDENTIKDYMQRAYKIFAENIEFAYTDDTTGIRDSKYIVTTKEGLAETLYRNCAAYSGIVRELNPPMKPDRETLIKIKIRHYGWTRKEAETYFNRKSVYFEELEKLKKEAYVALQKAYKECYNDIQVIIDYDIDNKWTEKLLETIENELLEQYN